MLPIFDREMMLTLKFHTLFDITLINVKNLWILRWARSIEGVIPLVLFFQKKGLSPPISTIPCWPVNGCHAQVVR